MTAGSWPKATPFDLETGAGAEDLSLLFGGPDAQLAGVLLLAGHGARRDGWAARVAVSLAAAWSQRSGTVVLADACFDTPELHGVLAEPNGEGVADVFQFGASLRRVRRTVEGRPFEFIPAGVYVPDPAGVLRHGAWTGLLEETLAAGRRLMVYAPATAEGVAELAQRIGAVVLLAAADGDLRTGVPNADVRAVLSPAGSEPQLGELEAVRARRPDAEFERLRLPQGEARETHIADLRNRQRSSVLGRDHAEATLKPVGGARVPPPPLTPRMPPPSPEAVLAEPRFAETAPEPVRRRFHPGMGWTLLVVLMLSLLGGAWHLWGREFWAARTGAGVATATTADSAAQADPAVPTGPVRPLPISVALEAHPDLPTALERVTALENALEGVGFLISPTVDANVVYYRVMAGPVNDSVAADSIIERLIAAGEKTVRTGTELQRTPLAFLVAEFENEGDARTRAEELRRLDIPTYVVPLAFPGRERYRLYAGAYTGVADADVMRQLLRSAGVEDSLVTRVGSTSP